MTIFTPTRTLDVEGRRSDAREAKAPRRLDIVPVLPPPIGSMPARHQVVGLVSPLSRRAW